MSSTFCDNTKTKRTLGVVLVLIVFIALVIPAVKFTIGQFHYEKGKVFSLSGQYSKALEQLAKASAWQPEDAAVQHELGLAHLKIALDMGPMLQKLLAAKAVEHFEKAQALNPLEPETAYTLARGSELLGEKNREQTLVAYRSAVDLWPNNSLYHRAFARELYRHGKEQDLLVTVQTLGSIDPASYGQLQREPYWSDAVQQRFVNGLEQAIARNIAPRQAHMALAAILEKQSQWEEASVQYQLGMGYESHSNTQHTFYRLGSLLLHTDADEAFKVFLQGLAQSDTREKDLEGLYNTFKNTINPELQLTFYDKVRSRFPLTYRLDILMARTLIDAKQYEEAKEVLEKVALQEHTPEPWYWLARIGELTEDWDSMELAIQKAVVRDPDNRDYRLMFSRALAKQQKYVQAEEQANRARGKNEKQF